MSGVLRALGSYGRWRLLMIERWWLLRRRAALLRRPDVRPWDLEELNGPLLDYSPWRRVRDSDEREVGHPDSATVTEVGWSFGVPEDWFGVVYDPHGEPNGLYDEASASVNLDGETRSGGDDDDEPEVFGW